MPPICEMGWARMWPVTLGRYRLSAVSFRSVSEVCCNYHRSARCNNGTRDDKIGKDVHADDWDSSHAVRPVRPRASVMQTFRNGLKTSQSSASRDGQGWWESQSGSPFSCWLALLFVSRQRYINEQNGCQHTEVQGHFTNRKNKKSNCKHRISILIL